MPETGPLEFKNPEYCIIFNLMVGIKKFKVTAETLSY